MTEKILTQNQVKKLGLDKVSVITADMLDGYTSIGGFAFEKCSGLASVTIPNSVTSIGYGAFYDCTGLTSIVVENGNSVYDSRNNCNALIETATNTLIVGCQNTTIPNSVTSIGTLAFCECSSLTSIEIPNSVTSIGAYAFLGCSGLTSIEIPNSVTNIGNNAFFGCHGLTSVVWKAKNCSSSGNFGSQVTSFTFGNDVEIIPPSFCAGMLNLTSIIIPNSVTSIGDFAFYGCSGLTGELIIPNSVTSIGDYAFEYCSGLTSVTIPNSVTSIGYDAFYDCIGLTSVTIPNSVTSIGYDAFLYCNNLTSVTIDNKEYKTQEVKDGKCKAYKAFNADMTCRKFQYEEGKTYEFNGEPKLCEQGFHACLNLADVFSYYGGEIGKNMVVHEVELEGVSKERNKFDSKVVAKKITIGKRIL